MKSTAAAQLTHVGLMTHVCCQEGNRMSDWMKAREYGTRLEAEIARARIESADIPVLIMSHEGTGVFGAGFQGSVPTGVELHVPTERLAEVRAILDSPRESIA